MKDHLKSPEYADTALVVVAGGCGRRFGEENKLFAELSGRPLFLGSLRTFAPLFPAGNRILVVPAAGEERFRLAMEKELPGFPFRLVPGGERRSDSVRAGLAAIPPGLAYVAIHDAARPLAGAELLARVLAAAKRTGGAVPGRPVTDTLKRIDDNGVITETVSRERLFAVETPQCFELARLSQAYRQAGPAGFTDDAAVMEAAGFPVAVVRCSGDNPKITYPADLARLR